MKCYNGSMFQAFCWRAGENAIKVTHLLGKQTASAWCGSSRGHTLPGRHVFFTFVEMGAEVTSRTGSSHETSCPA